MWNLHLSASIYLKYFPFIHQICRLRVHNIKMRRQLSCIQKQNSSKRSINKISSTTSSATAVVSHIGSWTDEKFFILKKRKSHRFFSDKINISIALHLISISTCFFICIFRELVSELNVINTRLGEVGLLMNYWSVYRNSELYSYRQPSYLDVYKL